MRRDKVLVRELLLFIEEHGSRVFKGVPKLDGYERNVVVDHLYLLADGGFIELGSETIVNKGVLVLTWKGCDFLDKIRGE